MNDIFDVYLNDIPEDVVDLTNQRDLLLNRNIELNTEVHNFKYALYALGAIAIVALIVNLINKNNYANNSEED